MDAIFEYDAMERELYPFTDYESPPYTPKPYVAPKNIIGMHNLPRFGNPNTLDAVVDGEAKDYIIGVVVGSIIILLVAVVWFMVIIGLRIAGQKRVGFLAGRLEKSPTKSLADSDGVEVVMTHEQEGEQAQDYGPVISDEDNKFNRKVWAVRGAFIVCGLCVITSGALFYGKGVVSFQDSLNEVSNGLRLVQNTAMTAINVTDSVIQAQDDVEQGVNSVEEADAGGSICGADKPIADQIRILYNQLASDVVEVRTMLTDTLSSFGDDLRDLVTLTEDIDNSLETANIFFYILIAISCVIITLIGIMIAGVFFAAKGWSNCFTRFVTNAVLWPIFVFFLILSWAFATLFLVASLAGADFCVEPDAYVQSFLDKNADKFDGVIFGFIIYYVSGCSILPAGEEEIRGIANQIRDTLDNAHSFAEILQNQTVSDLQEICGLKDASAAALQEAADLIHESTHVLDRSLVGVREILSCQSFNPIYNTFVHEAVCIQGVGGLTWIFATTLTMAIFAMLMIMFRAALYPVKEARVIKSSSAAAAEGEVVKYSPEEVEKEEQDEKEVQADTAEPVIY